MTFNFGDKVRDKITSFAGVVTGKCSYITGCDQILLAPDKTKDDGDIIGSRWFDVNRCELVEANVVSIDSVSSAARPGPDAPAPIK